MLEINTVVQAQQRAEEVRRRAGHQATITGVLGLALAHARWSRLTVVTLAGTSGLAEPCVSMEPGTGAKSLHRVALGCL